MRPRRPILAGLPPPLPEMSALLGVLGRSAPSNTGRALRMQRIKLLSFRPTGDLIRYALTVTLGLLTLIWGAFLIDAQFDLDWRSFGNRPLRTKGLIGILTMPFLHGDFQHLWGNTVSFFSLNAMLVYFYLDLGLKVLAWSWIGTGVLLWLSGAPGKSHWTERRGLCASRLPVSQRHPPSPSETDSGGDGRGLSVRQHCVGHLSN